jgi:hypothetical protein
VGDHLSNRKNIIIIIVMVILVVVLFYQNNQLKKDLESMEDNNIIQAEVIDEKEKKINSITKDYEEAIKTVKAIEAENKGLSQKLEDSKIIDYVTGIRLEKMGIDDYKVIEKDLLEKPELISIDGVLGGTMFFTDVHLLNEKWVYATFEDGHITGSGLYKFEIISANEIKWQEIQVTSD